MSHSQLHEAYLQAVENERLAKYHYYRALDLHYAAAQACQAGISEHSLYADTLVSDTRIDWQQASRWTRHCQLRLADVATPATSSEVAG